MTVVAKQKYRTSTPELVTLRRRRRSTSDPPPNHTQEKEKKMVTLGNLRLLYGDVVETATIVRSLLAPVASQLSGQSDLHRRCVLGYALGCFRKPGELHSDPATFGAFEADNVLADLAPFGAIEAVAVCAPLFYAVVVFKDESSVAVALRRQAETSTGLYSAVPPLDKALPLRCMPLDMIKVLLNPPIPASAALRAPRPLRALHWFQNYPGQPVLHCPYAGAPGTTEFWPCKDSLVYGPAVAVDGTLWMNGHLIWNGNGKGLGRMDPAWIRVVRIDRPDAYADGPPTFVPYVCYC